MASEQLRRESKIDDQEKKENVPKTSHFESLTVIDSGEQRGPATVVHQVIDTVRGGGGGGIHNQSQGRSLHSTESQKNRSGAISLKDVEQQKGTTQQSRGKDVIEQKGKTTTTQSMQKKGGDEKEQYKGPSLEEISRSRGAAQQQSMEAIRAATKNQSGATQTNMEKSEQQTGVQVKKNNYGGTQSVAEKVGQQTGNQAKEKISGVTQSAAEKVGQKTGDQTKKNLYGATQTAAEQPKNYSFGAQTKTEKGAQPSGEQFEKQQSVATQTSGKNDTSQVDERTKKSLYGVTQTSMKKGEQNKQKSSAAGQPAMEKDYPSAKYGQDKDIVSKETTGLTDAAVDVSKKGAEYAGKEAGVLEDVAMVAAWNAAEFASDQVGGVRENLEKVTDTVVDVGKKGVDYIGRKAVSGKDIAMETGKTTAEYGGKVAGVVEDTGLVAGWNAAEFASDKVGDVTKNIEDVTDTMVDVAGKRATYVGEKVIEGKDVAAQMGKTTAEYAGKAGGMLEDAAVVAAWNATEVASDQVGGMMENIKSLTDTMVDATDTAIDVAQKRASYVGEKVIEGKDVVVGIGKTTVEYASKAEGVLEDVGIVAGWEATKFASDKVGSLKYNIETVPDTVVDVSKRGAGYIGEKTVTGKDTMLETGKTATKYVGDMAGVVEDVGVVAGWEAARFVGDKGVGLKENIENATNTMADISKQGASYIGEKVVEGKDMASKTGEATTQYAGEMASVLGDVGVVSGWEAARFVGDKGVGLKENIGNATNTMADISKQGASYIGEGKDIASETGKATTQYAGEMASVLEDVGVVSGWEAARFVGDKGVGLKENMENATNTMADISKQGASYIGEKLVEGKDIASKTGKTITQYAGEMAGVLEDIGVASGWEAARFVGDKGVGLKENMENATNTMADVSQKGASYIGEKGSAGKDVTLETGKATAQFAGEVTGVLEDVGVIAGWEAAKFASDKGVSLNENIENVTNTMTDVSGKGITYIGEKVGAGKDITLEAGKTAVNFAGKVAGVVGDAAVMTGRNVAEFAGNKVGDMTWNIQNVTAGAARAVGDTTLATKDVLANVGAKTKGMVSETEESSKDYALRMNVEKERELQAKNTAPLKVEDELGGYTMKTRPIDVELDLKNQGSGGGSGSGGGRVIKVTKETTVEIGKNKKDKTIGRNG